MMFNFPAIRLALAAVIASSILCVMPLLVAQEQSMQAPAGPQANMSDKDLKAFAKAYVEYHKIRQTYGAQLSEAQDPKEKELIQHEGNSKAKAVLEKQGLTAQSYNRLFTSVNGNQQVRQRALKLIDEERNRS
jgi:uncharacterized protein DUF4168